MTGAGLADRLSELLMLARPPVAVSFRKDTPSADAEAVATQPAGCCYWAPAQKGRLNTKRQIMHRPPALSALAKFVRAVDPVQVTAPGVQ